MAVVYDFMPVTLADYPGLVASTVFVAGCNFHCPYCHNSFLIDFLPPDRAKEDEFFSYLEKRKKMIDGVVVTGGEPTLNPGLKEFILKVKGMGYKVKLDTNGSKPEVLEDLIKNDLLDYIAMDIKAPENKYRIFTSNAREVMRDIKRSIEITKKSGVIYEFRTTVHPGLLNIEDFKNMMDLLKGAERYVLQAYRFSEQVLDAEFCGKEPVKKEYLMEIKELLAEHIKIIEIRI